MSNKILWQDLRERKKKNVSRKFLLSFVGDDVPSSNSASVWLGPTLCGAEWRSGADEREKDEHDCVLLRSSIKAHKQHERPDPHQRSNKHIPTAKDT